MEKSEFLTRKNEIENSIKALNDEKKRLENEYINSQRVFADNEKIEIITKEHPYWTLGSGNEIAGINPEEKRFAFVVGYRINYQNEVEPRLKKCKKDGTISKMDDYFSPRLDSFRALAENV